MSDDWRKTWVENFEPSRFLGKAKMPILFVNGTNDFAYPLDSYQKSYRLVKNRNLCVTVNMPHGHSQGWAPVEIGLFVDQHLRGGKAMFRFDDPGVRMQEKDGAFTLAILQQHEIKSVSAHWTTDTKNPWQKRKWESRLGQRMVGNATDFFTVSLPKDRPLIYFLTATDERGATACTEHVVLTK
jgi:hypothetical protein